MDQSEYEIWIKKIAGVMGDIDNMRDGTTMLSHKRLGTLNIKLAEVVEQMRVKLSLERDGKS